MKSELLEKIRMELRARLESLAKAAMPQVEYAKGRMRVLEAFLARPSIFVLEELEARYGEPARANLLREIGYLAEAEAARPADA